MNKPVSRNVTSKPRKARTRKSGAARKDARHGDEAPRLLQEEPPRADRLEELGQALMTEIHNLKQRVASLEAERDNSRMLSAIRTVARHPSVKPFARALLRFFRPASPARDVRVEALKKPGGWVAAIEQRSPVSYPPPVRGRVLMSLHSSLPIHRAGYTYRTHALLKQFQDMGRDFRCYTRPGFPGDIRKLKALEPEGGFQMVDWVDGIAYRRLTATSRYARSGAPLLDYLAGYSAALKLAIREERPQIIHTASNFVNPAAGYLAAQDAGLPFVHEFRGFWELTQASRSPDGTPDPIAADAARIETEAAAHANRVLTLNGPMRDELAERGVDTNRIVIVPNAVDPDELSPMPRDSALAAALGLKDVPTIGYIGSFVHYEGLDHLVLAMHRLKSRGVKFNGLLVGDGEVFDELGRMVIELDLADEVRLTGRVEHALVPKYYSLIDIAPFPRKPFRVCELVSPLKPYEAMGMAKTVVVSSVAAQAEMVEDGKTGFVYRKGEADHLADRLELLVNDPELCRRVGEESRKWILGNRTWAHSARIVDEVYTQLSEEWDARNRATRG